MEQIKNKFIELVKNRSIENSKAIKNLHNENLIGNCVSILRQELDSFVRIIYLGRVNSPIERVRLMEQTLNGERWKVLTNNNKWKQVTDKEMVEKSSEIRGYIQFVYKFGCAFIHLSDFHSYKEENPFSKLTKQEQNDVLIYLNQFHHFSMENKLTVENISPLIIEIFEKISSNMACYFNEIINDEMIVM